MRTRVTSGDKAVLAFGYSGVVIILWFGMNLPLAVFLFSLVSSVFIYKTLGEENG